MWARLVRFTFRDELDDFDWLSDDNDDNDDDDDEEEEEYSVDDGVGACG